MQQYLEDVEFAAASTINAIWHESNEINKLGEDVAQLVRVAQDKYQRAEDLQQSEDIDDYMTGIGLMWDAYFNEEKDAYTKDKELDMKKQTYLTHEFAINSLSGSLLQMAKQGISIIHGGLVSCPDGRFIGSLSLKQIIWQARNQSIHFEEGNFKPPVVACFDTLANETDPKFSRYKTTNLAFEVISLLGWKSFENFRDDMLLLA